MTKMLEQAVEKVRELPNSVQDEADRNVVFHSGQAARADCA